MDGLWPLLLVRKVVSAYALRVDVGTRQGSFKMEASGIFKGAKVVRGADWEWKDQDGGKNMEGLVSEILGWEDEPTKDAVRVTWKEGQRANIYRLGRNGKVRSSMDLERSLHF